MVQTCTDADPRTTLLSIDGVGAFDLISRRAMLIALQDMPDGTSILPFVLQFYGHPSTHLWEDEDGVVHEIQQGEGGEQGDPLMPALFWAASGIDRDSGVPFRPTEKIMAFHDDVYVLTSPERVGPVEESMELELWEHARIRVNQGKTQVWNRCGDRPPNCEHLFNTDGEPNDAWRGDHDLPRTGKA